ncbi:ABC transporter permease [Cohnella fermenti]|uniref:Sugar ABC transporter permease n=1 Tax=Cohnella fermenti TaxID=2565925 RepID=A0A4S4BZU5_9BACL|nr:ABC transporter permease subunit [Cohnella fermenti]THF80307.1 sugar ABC transporter permease [Cohnella fermenti]
MNRLPTLPASAHRERIDKDAASGGAIRRLIDNIRHNPHLYLMVLPGVLGFLLFHYVPMYGIVIAFQDYDLISGFWHSDWVGMEHLVSFFNDPTAWRIIRNTLLLGFYSLLFGFWPPIVLALLLNEASRAWFKKIVQSVSYLPHFIAVVIVVGMLMQLTSENGLINLLLNKLGFDNVHFFTDPSYFRTMYVISDVWQSIGWNSILFLAALTGIDPELYEASYMDGASRFRRMLHISLPGIMPTISIVLILSASHIVSVGFEKVYLMQNPAIYEVADILATYVYRRGIVGGDFSFAAAVGLMNNIAALLILWVANRTASRLRQESFW